MRCLLLPLLLTMHLAVSAAGCTVDQKFRPDVVTDAAGGNVEAFVDQTIIVKLPATPGSGYSWTVERVPTVLERLDGPVSGPASAKDTPARPGAGATVVWRFKAVAPGSGILLLTYQRPWERGVPPVKTVRYHVTVAQ